MESNPGELSQNPEPISGLPSMKTLSKTVWNKEKAHADGSEKLCRFRYDVADVTQGVGIRVLGLGLRVRSSGL